MAAEKKILGTPGGDGKGIGTDKDGKIVVGDAALVVCARWNPEAATGSVQSKDFTKEKPGDLRLFWGNDEALEFTTGWEVLMAQAEVKNYLRSTPDKTVTMRYAGEYKIAGGNIDKGETKEQAARRELEEEVLRPAGLTLPADAKIRPYYTKQTMPVRFKSNMMWNYVALAEENPWLANLDVEAINRSLEERRRTFDKLVESGEYWKMTDEEKEKVSPEVRQVKWLSLKDAFAVTLSSMAKPMGLEMRYVDEFQKAEFAKYAVKSRDPMVMTTATLVHLESHPSVASLVQFTEQFDVEKDPLYGGGVQWHFTGMTQEEFKKAEKVYIKETRPKIMVPAFSVIRGQREQRLQWAQQENSKYLPAKL